MDTDRNAASRKTRKQSRAEMPSARQMMISIVSAYISAPDKETTVEEITDIVYLLLMEQGYEKDGIQIALSRLVKDRCGAETH